MKAHFTSILARKDWILENTGKSHEILMNTFRLIDLKIISASWSEWTECNGNCMKSRFRVCSESFGCIGNNTETVECPNTTKNCFQPTEDYLPEGNS